MDNNNIRSSQLQQYSILLYVQIVVVVVQRNFKPSGGQLQMRKLSFLSPRSTENLASKFLTFFCLCLFLMITWRLFWIICIYEVSAKSFKLLIGFCSRGDNRHISESTQLTSNHLRTILNTQYYFNSTRKIFIQATRGHGSIISEGIKRI